MKNKKIKNVFHRETQLGLYPISNFIVLACNDQHKILVNAC